MSVCVERGDFKMMARAADGNCYKCDNCDLRDDYSMPLPIGPHARLTTLSDHQQVSQVLVVILPEKTDNDGQRYCKHDEVCKHPRQFVTRLVTLKMAPMPGAQK